MTRGPDGCCLRELTFTDVHQRLLADRFLIGRLELAEAEAVLLEGRGVTIDSEARLFRCHLRTSPALFIGLLSFV